jgi:hypothetical protein
MSPPIDAGLIADDRFSNERLPIAIAHGSPLAAESPEQLAVDYLSAETPLVQRGRCFCHNNGDAARAPYVAIHKGYKVPKEALADTTECSSPSSGTAIAATLFSDKKLARIQFAASLVEACNAGVARDRRILTAAAESLLPYQEPDGSWRVDVGAVGAPATYGTALATYMARRTLDAASGDRFKDAITKANRGFVNQPDGTWAKPPFYWRCLAGAGSEKPRPALKAEAEIGGWGPYPSSPTEPFDTAVALLALQKLNDPDRTASPIAVAGRF